MKMEPLKSGDIRIWMDDDELHRWGLHPEALRTGAPSVRRAMHRLLAIARQRLEFRTEGDILVEALPLDGGCLFLFSAQSRWAATPPPQVYALEDAEALLTFAEQLPSIAVGSLPAASLYRQASGYTLILYAGFGAQTDCNRLLSEYGHRIGEGHTAASYIEEHAIPITIGNALHRLCAVYGSP